MVTTIPATSTRVTWAIDPAHTLVEFGVKHLMFTTVKGRFSDVSGTIVVDSATPERSAVDITIDVASVDTREPRRDAHLRSPDFFHAEQFPTITFTSTKVEPIGADRLAVHGDLTIHGVTRSVVLDTTYNGQATSPWGNEVVSYSAETRINRKDFGLTYNQALETGGVVVGDAIKIAIEVEAIKAA